MKNTLFYGDNLAILRKHVADASVHLIYLDPPFNARRDFNVLFKEGNGGGESEAQMKAFGDTWRWNDAADATYREIVTACPPRLARMVESLRDVLGTNGMLAYIVAMAIRLHELYRVLRPDGSLYLHCDPTASHSLKMVLDALFGPECYQNEILWQRTNAHNDSHRYGKIHDSILFYTKSSKTWTWNPQYTPYTQEYIDAFYRHIDPETGRRYRLDNLTASKPGGDVEYEWHGVKPYKGRYWAYSRANMERFEAEGRIIYTRTGVPNYKRYLDEMPGVPLQSVWTDIEPVKGKEDMGYDTQKPLKLLERIILSSSNPGDLVLDPFCGCGTAIYAAQKHGRVWYGIDVTHLAITIIRRQLADRFPDIQVKRDYEIVGEPHDVASARTLAEGDRYQFQWWALSLINGMPVNPEQKKGADRGIDGYLSFIDDQSGKVKRAIVQVKSGHVNAGLVRDLRGTMEREKAVMAIFLSLEPFTDPMRNEARAAGNYHSPGWNQDFPGIQLLTVEEVLRGTMPRVPPSSATVTFKKAPVTSGGNDAAQGALGGME